MRTAPVRRLRPGPDTPDPGDPAVAARWPFTVPAVRQLAARGLVLRPGVTVLVGENGSGKSSVVEVVAAALGLNAEGGSANARHTTRSSEPGDLGLIVERSPGASRWAYLLRDETLHGLYTYLEDHPPPPGRPETRYHERSHGEGLLAIVAERIGAEGVFLLDEPDAALSFGGTLTLLALLRDAADEGAQVLVATHSPVLAALPGAHLLEVGERGLVPTTWAELDVVVHQRAFLRDPDAYLRHLG